MRKFRPSNLKPTAAKIVTAGITVFLVIWVLVMAAMTKAAWLCLFGTLCS